MYGVFLFLLAMPQRKTSFYFYFFKLFKTGLRVFAGWLNSSEHVKSEHWSTRADVDHVVCWNLFLEIQGGSGVGWHWFALAEILILFYVLCV